MPLSVPLGTTIMSALDRVLRLPSVASKRFLTSKVDRSVTGLIAQQQCVGPLHIPLADCGVIAHSHIGVSGAVTAVGEQPIKGLLDPAAMARMTTAEVRAIPRMRHLGHCPHPRHLASGLSAGSVAHARRDLWAHRH